MSIPPGFEPDARWRATLLSPPSLVDAIGECVMGAGRALGDRLDFLGAAVVALGRLLLGRTRQLDLHFDTALLEAGVRTLPIVALTAFASGGILAILGMEQLEKLGVGPLSSRLVAIVILREMAALITGIALAGRLASGNAADLATKVAHGELEDLRRQGVEPMDALVAPRLLALTLMGPLLVTYACVLGLLGAMVGGVVVMGLSSAEHVPAMLSALSVKHAIAGLVKGASYGLLVGWVGCYHGLRSRGGRSDIGRTVQVAVVSAVLGVVLADAAVTLIFKWVRL